MQRKRINLFFFLNVIMGGVLTLFQMKKKLKKTQDIECKMQEFYRILVSWLSIRQRDMSLEKYFLQKGYRKVAIYGMRELGERLYEELADSDIMVKYAIDQNADDIYAKCEVKSPEDRLEDVDVIVVTAVHYYGDIKEMLCKKMECPIISIADIIWEIENCIV